MFQTNRNVLWISKSWSTPPVITSEYVEIKMKVDNNWKVYVPTSWNSASWLDSYWVWYNWDVYVWHNEPINISWSSSRLWYREVASWLNPWDFYYIKVLPHNINPSTWLPSYWRAMALWMWWWVVWSWDMRDSNYVAQFLYEVAYDWGKMWYRTWANSVWNWYKWSQRAWTINLQYPYEEVDASDITSLWSHYMACQYQNSWIITSAMESCPWSTWQIQVWFREQQYWRCSNLLTAATEVDPEWWYYVHSYREWQYWYCTSLESSAPENPPSYVNWWVEYKFNQYKWCTNLRNVSSVVYAWWWNSQFREWQFLYCWSPSNKVTVHLYWSDVVRCTWAKSLWLDDANVHRVYVPSSLLQAYKDSDYRSNIDDNKFFRN